MIKLGDKVKNKITGFTGIVTSHVKYLYDVDSFGVTPVVDKEGKKVETEWFTEPNLEIISES